MVEIDITGFHPTAQQKADSMPVYRGSMRGKKANEAGCMGELVALRYFDMCGLDYTNRANGTHIIDSEYGTFNVKTKERTVAPKDYYECSVQRSNRGTQNIPDWYIFVSLMSEKGVSGCERFTRAWVLGTITSDDFYSNANLVTPGQGGNDNGWSAKIPCYNISISALRPPKTHKNRQPENKSVSLADLMG